MTLFSQDCFETWWIDSTIRAVSISLISYFIFLMYEPQYPLFWSAVLGTAVFLYRCVKHLLNSVNKNELATTSRDL